MTLLEFQPRIRVICGPGVFPRLGLLAREQGFRRCLLVADKGVRDAGYSDFARRYLEAAAVEVFPFHDFSENPNTAAVEVGRRFAETHAVDSIVGLGGGSSMDFAKGVNFVFTNGGRMKDYWGYGKASKPMLPMIGVPTTAGTGSEAQSYTLITDSETHMKLACGDPKASFKVAILDPVLCLTAPRHVKANSGYDAISHAVETWVTRKKNPLSDAMSWQSWKMMNASFEKVMTDPADVDAMGQMLMAAHFAGTAIENSMLGASHACANPLTAKYDTTHGVAIAVLLRHVVQWNSGTVGPSYRELHPDLIGRLEDMAQVANLPRRLRDIGVSRDDFQWLTEQAAPQWTGRFNPRHFDAAGAREIYECAW